VSASVERAFLSMFRGWSSVSTYTTPHDDRYHVHLSLDSRVFLSEPISKGEIINRLFERSDARHAIELVKLARGKAVGMRFYGRKRR